MRRGLEVEVEINRSKTFQSLTSAEPARLLGGLPVRRAEHGAGARVAEAQRRLLPSRRRDGRRGLHFFDLFLKLLSNGSCHH